MPDVLRARGVRVRLGQSLVVRDVDLSVRDGEAVALMGVNGSGKSTLVRALIGIVPVEAGSVELFGALLSRGAGGTSWRSQRSTGPWQRIGYVPQRVTATAGVPATALELVTSGLLHRGRLRPPRDARARATTALARVGLADKAHAGVRELSGGQQQRVLIARALVREPDLLLLDEPVAGVDRPTQLAFADTLTELLGQGCTVLVVLHELGTFAPLITRSVVLRDGAVVHDGPTLPPAPGHDAPDHVHLHPHESREGPSHLGEPVLGPRP